MDVGSGRAGANWGLTGVKVRKGWDAGRDGSGADFNSSLS